MDWLDWSSILNEVDWQTPFRCSEKRREFAEVYPRSEEIFKALWLTPFDQVKVVILGQDPYPSPGHADGLAFSVSTPVCPPSLKNIFDELKTDLDVTRTELNLNDWAEQGVLLLNSVLTVEKNLPGSHKNFGWQVITDHLIELLSKNRENLVFILWGKYAQQKEMYIDTNKHKVIKSAHPSPLSALKGFFGSRPFSETNKYLFSVNKEGIIW